MKLLKRWFRSPSRSATPRHPETAPKAKAASAVESLEGRVLFAGAPPTVEWVHADNRGEVTIQLSERLRANTVNNDSVLVHHAGADGTVLTADDVKLQAKVRYIDASRRIYITALGLTKDKTYRVKLDGKTITSFDGYRLDGEFNGATLRSGNGVRGGDFLFASVRDKGRRPVARFYTSYGAVDVMLFKTNTPITVENFLHYANEGAYDGTFFHRSIANFIVQGGGFNINTGANTLGTIHQHAPITNEPVLSNIRGRISMAKLGGDPNSATNQWFFNLSNDNAANLDFQNGGFTTFGEVLNLNSFAVLGNIASLGTRDDVNLTGVGAGFDDVPFRNAGAYDARGEVVDPNADLVTVRRVAMINQVVAIRA